jgi:hypothetical protein
MTITLEDGVYVNLDAEKYFAADRLGSTDLVVLHNRPADWFYRSRHNPFYERHVTEEMEFGSALHLLLLEGEDAYRQRCIVKPTHYPEGVKFGEEFDPNGPMKPWNGNANWCKAWLERHDRADVHIIDEDMDRRVRHMTALIQNHPELGEPMRKGLSEVSILWTHEATGLRLRARFDKLLPRFTVDLKSFGGNGRGIDMTQQCLWLVKDRHYDVQRFMYFLARQAMGGLISQGRVFGATGPQADWLARVATVETWRWCWIFYRRRDDAKGHAPIVKPIYRSHFDATFESGRQKFEVAVANYRTFVDRFGFDVPWAVVEQGEEPPDHAMPIGLNDCPKPFTFPEPEKDAA